MTIEQATISDLRAHEFDFSRSVIVKEYAEATATYFELIDELDTLTAHGKYSDYYYERRRQNRKEELGRMIALQSEKSKIYDSWFNGHRDSKLSITVDKPASPERYVWGEQTCKPIKNHNYPKTRKSRKTEGTHVYYNPKRKKRPYNAYSSINGVRVHIGYYATKEEAVAAYDEWFTQQKEQLIK
jgi:hypothetical protein